ncbi:very short patch repair endonuclease [Mucilaginibacter sp. L3T2-6]|uniref:very short patch repair endonuclease n=1 Tax=Mucilaginibacter sp. L3T2-6 TaxID=3062491 RepID=UPI00267513C2|nr:very short patch repair endonuclease [Mucilaginibacter sp. L3T2-6]MDO3643491.1 very short patch repair endonuclease [Mucilaginibacter sp. L3T2-6]MDV6215942.1 very short patch repair endonuclease [Mucilaginibacter sp. L3T2-6]
MADRHSPETRSYNMSRIPGKNTKPELLVRKFLFSKGFRYRLHNKGLPGTPDIILPKYKTVVFINGCFWHGHDSCKYFSVPKTRTEWWLNKINKNKFNDNLAHQNLIEAGWKVIYIWGCELKKTTIEPRLAQLSVQILKNLKS